MFKRYRNRKGFSLIELLIVIAIIGIIATIAIPILLTARAAAVNEKARNSCRAAVSAEFAFYAATGAYGDDTALVAGGYLDNRWTTGTLGNGLTRSITSTGQTFVVTVANPGPVPHTYTATENGVIVET